MWFFAPLRGKESDANGETPGEIGSNRWRLVPDLRRGVLDHREPEVLELVAALCVALSFCVGHVAQPTGDLDDEAVLFEEEVDARDVAARRRTLHSLGGGAGVSSLAHEPQEPALQR